MVRVGPRRHQSGKGQTQTLQLPQPRALLPGCRYVDGPSGQSHATPRSCGGAARCGGASARQPNRLAPRQDQLVVRSGGHCHHCQRPALARRSTGSASLGERGPSACLTVATRKWKSQRRAESRVGPPPPPIGACLPIFVPPFRACRRSLVVLGFVRPSSSLCAMIPSVHAGAPPSRSDAGCGRARRSKTIQVASVGAAASLHSQA